MMKEYIAKQGQTLEEISWLLNREGWEDLFENIILLNLELVDPENIFLKGGEAVFIPDFDEPKPQKEVSLW